MTAAVAAGWAVRVSEIVVLYHEAPRPSGHARPWGRAWWALLCLQAWPEDRLRVVEGHVGGCVVDVLCDDRDEAQWLLHHMIDNGLPRHGLDLVRVP